MWSLAANVTYASEMSALARCAAVFVRLSLLPGTMSAISAG
jgi:hypothetical protein